MTRQSLRGFGFFLLAVYLILIGISAFLPISYNIPIQGYSAVALVAGILILLGK